MWVGNRPVFVNSPASPINWCQNRPHNDRPHNDRPLGPIGAYRAPGLTAPKPAPEAASAGWPERKPWIHDPDRLSE